MAAQRSASSAGEPPGTVRSFIGLGSNLGDREANLRSAVDALRVARGVELCAVSRTYETEPVGPPQGRYLNAAVELATSLAPLALLEVLLRIEREAGRTRDPEQLRWGPRVLDLDLLLYGTQIVEEPGLRVPHPRLHERSFVLIPLLELAPGLLHPTLGQRLDELAARLEDGSGVRPWPS